jgi:hypothetical protein
MGIGEKRVVIEHVVKGVIVNSEKQIYRWVCMANFFIMKM